MAKPNATREVAGLKPNRFHLPALACVALLIAAACGQKPGVATSGSALPEGATVNAQGQIVDAEGNVIGNAGDLSGSGDLGSSAVGGGTTGETAGVPTTSGTTGEGTSEGGTTEGGASGGAAAGGATSTGVTNDLIKIGAHAPLTGAAPVPSASAQQGSKLLWEWMKQNKQIDPRPKRRGDP